MFCLDHPRLLGLGWLGAALGTRGTGTLLLLEDPKHSPFLAILLADRLVLGSLVLLHVAVMEVVKLRRMPYTPGTHLRALSCRRSGTRIGFFWMTTAGLTAKLEGLAITDTLTGVLNRRAFMGCLQAEFLGWARSSESLALLMLDVDHLKQVNDRYAHSASDEVLCAAFPIFRMLPVDLM